MEIEFTLHGLRFRADAAQPIELGVPVQSDGGARAWYVGPPRFEPVRMGDWVGSVAEGGSVNFRDVYFNPHGHGTHTECLGHITAVCERLPEALPPVLVPAAVITVQTEVRGEDRVLTGRDVCAAWDRWAEGSVEVKACVLRTAPPDPECGRRDWSNSNPPYLEAAAAKGLADRGVEHLLLDLPSVDREVDGGALAAHRAFWRVPDAPRRHATITEMIHVPEGVADGVYLLNLQVALLDNDAVPSRPVLFRIFARP